MRAYPYAGSIILEGAIKKLTNIKKGNVSRHEDRGEEEGETEGADTEDGPTTQKIRHRLFFFLSFGLCFLKTGAGLKQQDDPKRTEFFQVVI